MFMSKLRVQAAALVPAARPTTMFHPRNGNRKNASRHKVPSPASRLYVISVRIGELTEKCD